MQLYKIRDLLKKSSFLKLVYNRYKELKKDYQLKQLISKSNSLKIVFGASGVFDNGWIPTDIDNLNLLKSNDWAKYFKLESIDAMLAEHVWEHLTLEESSVALKNCFSYLKHGGYFRMAVPDGYHPDKKYIEHVKVGGTGKGSDDHKVLYTYKTLKKELEGAGFSVQFLEYFDEDGKFNFKDWNPEQGTIHRSKCFDSRNKNGSLSYTSIIVDAYKK